ncbi:MAG: serine/threonine-protein kinase [Polyangiaceae bacterium]|jgi:serine/threonine-protein kinase
MAEGPTDSTRDPIFPDGFVGTLVNGRFQIVRRIARGGMGSVYFATQAPLRRPVALKVVHVVRNGQGESEESFRRRFLLEASILARLQHPNIVVLFDYGPIANMAGEHYFMAMEYLRGETLARRFKIVGRLGIAESLRIVRQIARGLRESHRSGFIHRDLKPSNIMLVPDDEKNDVVKLVDFGIGKVVPSVAGPARDADATQTGLVLGSPRYMSPEQIRSEPVEPRTDLYALGVILFEGLTGHVPFGGDTSFDIMASHCLKTPPELSDVCPGERFPPSLCRLVAALLQKRAIDRPTAEQFLNELSSIEHETFGHRQSVSAFPSLSPAVRDGVTPASSGQESPSRSWRGRSPPPAADDTATLGATLWRSPAPRKTLVIGGIVGVLGLCLMLGRSVADRSLDPRRSEASPARTFPPAPAGSAEVMERDMRRAIGETTSDGVFLLTVESIPTGAGVAEDGKILGTTPLGVMIDRATVARGPRTFVVQLAGYAPTTFEQGDSEVAVRQLVTLAPQTRTRFVTQPRSISTPPPDEANRSKHDESPGLDIRLRR